MIEEDLDRVEKCINRNLMKCHKEKNEDTMCPCTQNPISIQGCWRQCTAIRSRVFFPLLSVNKITPGVLDLAPQEKTYMDCL